MSGQAGDGQAGDSGAGAPAIGDAVTDRVVALVNAHRAAVGLAPVVAQPRLQAAAREQAAVMAANDFLGHDGPNGALDARLARVGYRFGTAAENVAAGFATPAEVVAGWMASAGHRRNMLNPAVREVGVGYVFVDGDGARVATEYTSYWALIVAVSRGG